jgi:hypothetical protein
MIIGAESCRGCCDAGVGEISSKMRTVGIWVNNRKENEDDEIDYQRGIIYYLQDNKIKVRAC